MRMIAVLTDLQNNFVDRTYNDILLHTETGKTRDLQTPLRFLRFILSISHWLTLRRDRGRRRRRRREGGGGEGGGEGRGRRRGERGTGRRRRRGDEDEEEGRTRGLGRGRVQRVWVDHDFSHSFSYLLCLDYKLWHPRISACFSRSSAGALSRTSSSYWYLLPKWSSDLKYGPCPHTTRVAVYPSLFIWNKLLHKRFFIIKKKLD